MYNGTYVELTPCKAYNDPTATGAGSVYARVFSDFTHPVPPVMVTADVGDIMAYIMVDSTYGPPLAVLVSGPILTPGTADYQVLQMQSGVGVFDYVRAH